MANIRKIVSLLSIALAGSLIAAEAEKDLIDPTLTEDWTRKPQEVVPGKEGSAPSDAIILLKDKNLEAWIGEKGPVKWANKKGTLTVKKGTKGIRTKEKFGDCQLHVEWRSPVKDVGGKNVGQHSGNSGIFIMGRYELQVLNSFENKTYYNGMAGSIYKQHIPLVNPTTPPGTWQAYDIIFTAPRFNEDKSLKSPARVTVLLNGVLVQNNVEIKGPTVYRGEPSYQFHSPEESLMLQNHGDPVSYRNIWIRRL